MSGNSVYIKRSQAIIDAACQQELMALIWGPGRPRDDATPEAKMGYKKRCQIRDEVSQRLPQSYVAFSEDVPSQGVMGVVNQETLHAESADLIIILAISRGADFELGHFAGYDWFPTKAWLLAPKQDLDTPGMMSEIYKLIPETQRQGYTREQFDLCQVAGTMSVNVAITVALMKKRQRRA